MDIGIMLIANSRVFYVIEYLSHQGVSVSLSLNVKPFFFLRVRTHLLIKIIFKKLFLQLFRNSNGIDSLLQVLNFLFFLYFYRRKKKSCALYFFVFSYNILMQAEMFMENLIR